MNYKEIFIVNNKLPTYVATFLLVLIVVRVYLYGWVTDDAFITFRSVINFINGDGLVYNIGERVQSYTHPLWFLILSGFAFFDTNLYFLSITLGLLFTTLMLLYLKKLFQVTSSVTALIVAFILLFNSDIFLQFSTSGLENSLTNFLLVSIFYYFFVHYENINRGKAFNIFIISIMIGLLLTNRLDQLFIMSPLIVYLFLKNYKFLLIGMLPLVSWHVFSLIYYGFLFPNTKYAKIGARSLSENLESGFSYFLDSLQADFLFFGFLFFVLSVSIYKLIKSFSILENRQFILLVTIGIVLHIIYVIMFAGGDFMRGRFFISILIMSLVLFAFLNIKVKLIGLVILGIASFISYNIGFHENFVYKTHGLENERNFYKSHLALNLNPYNNYTQHPWGLSGQTLNSQKQATIVGVNGQWGYWINKTKLIDLVGLTDAYIARTPVIDNKRTGHFKHKIPGEYFIIQNNKNANIEWENKKDEELYKNLNIVITGPIFSKERLNAQVYIWKNYGI